MAPRMLVSSLLLLSAVLTTVQAAAQSAPTAVTISVPAVRVLEGPSSIAVAPGAIQRTALVVKSNVPWVLVGRPDGWTNAVVWKRVGSSLWNRLSRPAVLAHGEKGVHLIEIELRPADPAAGEPARVTFALGAVP